MNLHEVSSGDNVPQEVRVVVEIPKGSKNKIEYDHNEGIFIRDRVLHASVRYPGDYGFVPSTLADDGDPLDVLVLVEEPTFPGCVLNVRPIGILELIDEEDKDDKILAVPVSAPNFDDVNSLEDLPDHTLDEIKHFFSVYKNLEGKEVSPVGWQSVNRAHEVIEGAIETGRQDSSGGGGCLR